jgi:hypothetical protein
MNDLQPRTKKFALAIILFSRKLPPGEEFSVIKQGMIRAAADIARICRIMTDSDSGTVSERSNAAREKAEEVCFWLELLRELATREHMELSHLNREAEELATLFSSMSEPVG